MPTLDEITAAAQLVAIEKEISQKWTTVDGPSTHCAPTGEPYVTVAAGIDALDFRVTDTHRPSDSPVDAVARWKRVFDQWSAPFAAELKLYWRARPQLGKHRNKYAVIARLLITGLPEDPRTIKRIREATPIPREKWNPLPGGRMVT